jgi:hypothetical protein
MEGFNERPSFAPNDPKANGKTDYIDNFKPSTFIRNDLNALIKLQGQQIDQTKELVILNRKILEQLTKHSGGRS